jgi:hypothetical protein
MFLTEDKKYGSVKELTEVKGVLVYKCRRK